MKKVFVGMSGGVDSSVSAHLLKEAGYDVTGVFIKAWEAPFLPCTWREERREAQRAAAYLGIPLVTLDLGEEYKKSVVDVFVDAYRRGVTPNPDVLCNKEIKFGSFFRFAKAHGADLIATGHYAQVKTMEGVAHLFEGTDGEKDQSYFLWAISQEALASTLFPIGGMEKSQVRSIAERVGLPNAKKKDSQGICFLGMVDMADFLREILPCEKGAVLDESGRTIGEHDGAILYTLGERHGFRVSVVTPDGAPWYVVEKDMDANTITVAHKDKGTSLTAFAHDTFAVEGWHAIAASQKKWDKSLTVRLRYHQEPIPFHLSGNDGKTGVLSSKIDGIAVGQSAVVYRGSECLGGGIIASIT